MPALTLTAPTDKLRSAQAGSSRTIGYAPVKLDSAGAVGGAQTYLKQVPGLRPITFGVSGVMKPNALMPANGKLYAVIADKLLAINEDWTYTDHGFVAGGDLSWAVNETQLCLVASPNAYVLDFASGDLSKVPGEWSMVEVLDGYGVFLELGTSQFFVSSNQDFTVIDDLSYASTESSPGDNVAILIKHREAVILKSQTGEIWYNSGAADFPMSRNDGAPVDIGVSSSKTLKKLAGVAYWLGEDNQGQRVVFRMGGYVPERISSQALEEALTGVDVSDAYAFSYHQEGLGFYVLQVPGLETTWVYEVTSGTWTERCDWDGDYMAWPALCHALFGGDHVVGDADGNLYKLDPTYNKIGTREMVRDIITRHTSSSTLRRERIGSLQLSCDVAQSLTTEAHILMRYSDDGGRSWSNWRIGSLGDVGRTTYRVRWTRLGASRDRVWHFRVTDDVMCNVIAAVFNEV